MKLGTPAQRALVCMLLNDTYGDSRSAFAIQPKSYAISLALFRGGLLKLGDAGAAARTIAVPSMQELADKMLPDLYMPLSDFAGQLYA